MDVEEIQRRAKKGPRALLARRVFAVCIGLTTTVTIPHLVSPRAYGLAAMSTVIFGLAEMFKDFGLTSALLRKGEVHPDEITFLFWFNCATTLCLAAVIAASAPLSVLFFHEKTIAPVILFSLIGFVTSGLALQHRGVLSRNLRFQELAAIDAFALLIQFSTTLTVALITHDVWAIVAGNIASAFVAGTLTVAVSRWRPGPPRWLPEARALFAFGANTSVYTLAVFAANNIAAILVGRYFGPVTLGYYNRATALQVLPAANAVEPLAQATLPVLARLRPHPDLYRRAYLSLVRNLNIIVLPASVGLFFIARSLVAVALGARWAETGQILQALAPAVAGLGFGYAAGDLFITQNRSAELRNLGLFELTLRVAGVCAGLAFGPTMVAAGFSLSSLTVVAIRITVASRTGPVTLRDHLSAAGPALPLAIGVVIGCMAGQAVASVYALAVLPTLVAVGGAGAVVCVGLGVAAKPSRNALADMAATLRGGERRAG